MNTRHWQLTAQLRLQHQPKTSAAHPIVSTPLDGRSAVVLPAKDMTILSSGCFEALKTATLTHHATSVDILSSSWALSVVNGVLCVCVRTLPIHDACQALTCLKWNNWLVSWKTQSSLKQVLLHGCHCVCCLLSPWPGKTLVQIKREYYQNSSVLDCVTQCSQSAAHLCEQFLQVKQIGFVTLRPLRCA